MKENFSKTEKFMNDVEAIIGMKKYLVVKENPKKLENCKRIVVLFYFAL